MARKKFSPVRKLPSTCHECKCEITGVENQARGRPGLRKVGFQYYWLCGQCKPTRKLGYEWLKRWGRTNEWGWPCDENGKGTTIDKVVKFRIGYEIVENDDGEEVKQPILVPAHKGARKFKPSESDRPQIVVNPFEKKERFEDKKETENSTNAILDLFR